jgi:hypothetical protein
LDKFKMLWGEICVKHNFIRLEQIQMPGGRSLTPPPRANLNLLFEQIVVRVFPRVTDTIVLSSVVSRGHETLLNNTLFR